jgi:hypothetical protein
MSLILMLAANIVSAQRVVSTSFVIENSIATITYKIKDWTDEQSFKISLFVSNDGGINFKGPLKFVTGDVGLIKNPGGLKKIKWDIFNEFDELSGNILFEVRAEVINSEVPIQKFINYNYTPTAPIGFRLGILSNYGAYACFKSNLTFSKPGEYLADNSGLIDYSGSGYWVMGNNKQNTRYSITGGGLFKFKRNFIVYAGLGYGVDNLLWQYDEYSFSDFNKVKTDYALNQSASINGLELELGLMVRLRKILLSGGVGTIGFKYVEFNIGGGFIF